MFFIELRELFGILSMKYSSCVSLSALSDFALLKSKVAESVSSLSCWKGWASIAYGSRT